MEHSPKITAYIDQIKSGSMLNDKNRIVERLLTGAQTIETLVVAINKPYRTVSARLSDLTDEGLVKMTTNPISNKSIFSIVNDVNEQNAIAKKRIDEKKAAWVKRGFELGLLESYIPEMVVRA